MLDSLRLLLEPFFESDIICSQSRERNADAAVCGDAAWKKKSKLHVNDVFNIFDCRGISLCTLDRSTDLLDIYLTYISNNVGRKNKTIIQTVFSTSE